MANTQTANDILERIRNVFSPVQQPIIPGPLSPWPPSARHYFTHNHKYFYIDKFTGPQSTNNLVDGATPTEMILLHEPGRRAPFIASNITQHWSNDDIEIVYVLTYYYLYYLNYSNNQASPIAVDIPETHCDITQFLPTATCYNTYGTAFYHTHHHNHCIYYLHDFEGAADDSTTEQVPLTFPYTYRRPF